MSISLKSHPVLVLFLFIVCLLLYGQVYHLFCFSHVHIVTSQHLTKYVISGQRRNVKMWNARVNILNFPKYRIVCYYLILLCVVLFISDRTLTLTCSVPKLELCNKFVLIYLFQIHAL